jgi:hypothetical protein
VIKRAATKPLRFSSSPVFAFKISWAKCIATGGWPLYCGVNTHLIETLGINIDRHT